MTRLPHSTEITPEELARTLENRQSMQVLDIRAPARVANGRIDLVGDDHFHNIVGSRLIAMTSSEQVGLDPDQPVAVVCGHGNSSKPAARHLYGIGYSARSLRGGMAAWMLLLVQRALDAPRSLDQLIQFDRIGKGALGYLLVSNGEALLIDPARETGTYLHAAEEAGAKIVAVADTHVHADYISGGPALARSLGVPYYLHPRDAVYPYDGTPGRIHFESLADGQEISIGRAIVRTQHTPGHTEGSVTYLVDDDLAFTGDFIFVGSIGRPDLGGKTAEWTEQLWASLERSKAEWSREIMIYPAHYGTETERSDDRSVGGRFGTLCEQNRILAIADGAQFARWVQGAETDFPEAYRRIKAINVGLETVDDLEAEELEVGKNECALGGRSG